MEKVRFGILSTAKIAIEKVIPALQKSAKCEVSAICSRNKTRAEEVASDLKIPVSYGSYEELLADETIDAVYIPLPNHLHVQWSVKCLEAGKHVLCEKPIGMDAGDAKKLLEVSKQYPGLKVTEAFMYRHHPRWKRVVELVRGGKIGDVKTVHSFFSYYNDDPKNYRNSEEMGGGGLMDVGCYCVSTARLIFGKNPVSAFGVLEYDPVFKTDRLASGLLNFETGTSVFSCSTQCHKDQFVKIYGTKGMIELDWPFNPDFSKPTVLTSIIDGIEIIEEFPPCDHFSLQGDAFAEAILRGHSVPLSLEDSVENMEVIDMIRQSGESKS